MSDPLHGLRYPDTFLAALPVLDHRPPSALPVRILNPHQFADIHLRYLNTHPPDHVLFPFLHGLEGNNHAQNAFFASARAPSSVPRFRGLIWVAADHDADPSDSDVDADDDLDELDDSDDDYSTESSLDSFGPMDMDVDVDVPMHLDPTLSGPVVPGRPPPAKAPSPLPSAPAPALVIPHARSPASRPPPPSALLTSSFRPRELLLQTTDANGTPVSVFVEPKVPDGISLRNFGIQVPIYATLSDIVVYSPRGNARAAHALAERFAEAVERKLMERRARHADPDELVVYNVFVLDAPPAARARALPHLMMRTDDAPAHTDGTDAHTLGAPSDRCLRANTVDFARREKEEMRDLTQASELISVVPPESDVDATLLSGSTPASHWHPAVGQVFLGNANDVPLPPDRCLRVRRDADELDENAFDPCENSPAVGAGFDICIECHDFAPFPSTAHIRAAEEHFTALERHWVERCVAEADPEADPHTLLPPRPPPSPAAIVHLPFPSSPPASAAAVAALMPFLALLDALLQPPAPLTLADARAQLAPSPLPPVQHHSAFAPSSLPPPSAFPVSFFTEPAGPQSAYTRVRSTSATSLPTPPSSSPPSSPASSTSSSSHSTSTTHTHTTTNTSINSSASYPPALRTRPAKVLVYSADGYTESSVLALTLLMARAELSLPHAYLALQLTKRRSFFVYPADLTVLRRIEARFDKDRANVAADAHVPPSPPPPVRRPAAQSVSFSEPLARPPRSGLTACVPQGRPRACTLPAPPLVLGEKAHTVWFDDPRFDGSFPSRVLPFLYLGNLNHAVNAYMLHALGITHVVSVGECALVPPPGIEVSASMPAVASAGAPPLPGAGGHSSLWTEERAGRIKVLDIKGVCDDGIDTLAPQLEPICAWIDRAREEGGRVLVHCRVGVSRSATVTIAYVMKHLGLPLVDAYLIVRSRRLSVLIQPNMRLLYNLLGWELALARERAGGDETRLRAELARSLNWPYLAKEVHALNEKYLH